MKTSTGLPQIKLQATSLFARVCIAILLAAVLVAWAPGKASAAGIGEMASSGCALSAHWEFYFAQPPNTPIYPQSPCISETGGYTRPDSSVSQYWEHFYASNPNAAQVAQSFILPVTGGHTRPDSSVPLY